MPKKKSVKRAAQQFIDRTNAIAGFLFVASIGMQAEHLSWSYEYAVLRLYREFESLLLHVLVGAINNDTSTISKRTGVEFPVHLTDDVCEFLVIRDGYFDFRGRDGLIQTLRRFLPDNHYLLMAVKRPTYKTALEQLCALRNYAAHSSRVAKRRAKEVLQQGRIGSAGSWLKVGFRFDSVRFKLVELAREIEAGAPY